MIVKSVIAVDLGASNGRVILASLENEKLSLEELHRFSNAPMEKEGQLFWDIDHIMVQIEQGLVKYHEQYDLPISGIGVDTWGVDFGFVDEDNRLLDNPYSYRGTHTDDSMEEVHEMISDRTLFERTGVESAPINSLYQLAAILKERPDIKENMAVILTLPSLINFLLTGEKYNEFTHASTTQLLHVESKTWDDSMIETVFSEELPLAPIKETNTISGTLKKEIADKLGATNIPVINVPGHDTACALAAMPITNKDTAFMSCGTWVLIGVETDKPITSEKAYTWGFTNEGTVEGNYRLQKNNMGLWLLQQCKKEWEETGEGISYEEERALLLKGKPFQSLIDPDHDSFFNPDSMIQAIQDFCRNTNQPVPETKSEILRCILESLALKYRWVMERLEILTDRPIPSIHMAGGGIQNQLLCQFTANATKKKVASGPIEASSIGNALSQFIAIGEYKNLREIRQVSKHSFTTKDYAPEDGEAWEQAYRRFQTLFE